VNTEQALPVPVRYVVNDEGLPIEAFLDLVQRVWPGSYLPALAQQALRRTVNITAWHGEQLVGCVRLLTDGYFFGTIPEILVDPAWQGQGIGRRLMDLAWEASPTSVFLDAQPGNEGFFERLGYERSLPSYARRKPRRTAE
jgi:ribosomal protein S18 acetylase RimI-like enzyme